MPNVRLGGVADFLYPTSKLRRGRVQSKGQISPTITAENTGVCKVEENKNFTWDDTEYRIRKITPREAGRLMDVEDKDIDTILDNVSNTQAYKQFGNSIVVSVLCAVYSQLNIQDIKPWNERTIEEKRLLTAIGKQKRTS